MNPWLAVVWSLPVVAQGAVPAPPPVIATRSQTTTDMSLIAWTPEDVRCSGTLVNPVRLERPWLHKVWNSPTPYTPVTYNFAIDGDGRPISIHKADGRLQPNAAEDLAPALAVSRFASGSPRTDCSIAYSPIVTRLSDAPLSALIAYSANPVSGPLPTEAWNRISADGNCRNDRSALLRTRAYPNFRAIAGEPGVRDWSLVGYDIGKDGTTQNIETIAGSGNSALDAASRKAVSETRYWSGGFIGCRFPYWRAPATLAAPAAPEEEAFRPADSTCQQPRDWVRSPSLRFPEPYRRRAVEGWAVLTYDVAPWGEISNIQVQASQPSEDFGTQAIGVLRSARMASGTGAVGCVERVRFAMAREAPDPAR